MRWTMALLITMRRCVALRAPAPFYRRRCLTAMLDTTNEPLDAATVDWRGLRAEAARRLDRATKKIAKKSAKNKQLPESVEALKKTEAERDQLRELVDALNAVDGSAEALTLANALGVRDAPPPRQPRVGRVSLVRRRVDATSPRRRGPKKKKGPSSTAPRLPYNAFASESGVEIRVGRRASDNDLLSCDFRYRDGADWWLHAAGCPGSHVVIRSHDDNLPSNDGDAVRDAACLAALFSKAIAKPPPGREHEASGRASVSLTRARHVSKPPGAKPGLVALKGDVTTIRVDLGAEGKRLKRLMATKDAVE